MLTWKCSNGSARSNWSTNQKYWNHWTSVATIQNVSNHFQMSKTYKKWRKTERLYDQKQTCLLRVAAGRFDCEQHSKRKRENARCFRAFELRKRDGLSQRGSSLLQPIHCRQTLYLYAWPSQHYTHARALGQYRFVVRMTQPQDAKLNDYISQEDTMTAIHVL